jgi:phospholipid/cholesterol/gamma-HCH transport system ATP-binding protein
MVFQFGALFDSMTVSENIGLALQKLTNCDRLEINDRISKSLREVNMEGTEEKMPSELSGGMKKRVGIARAIALNPQYMLYDEPTTGLDPIMTDSINRLINNFHSKGRVTSVVVTHEMRTVRDVSDRVLMLYNGEVQFDGSTEDFLSSTDPRVMAFLNGDSTYKE